MLEQLDLTKSMSKGEYKQRMDILEPKLAKLQRDCLDEKIPVMIVFEGFGAAGKGEQISHLIHALDPRGFYVESIGPESEEEKLHPFMWRFWMNLPSDTQIAIFDRSWYRKVVEERMSAGSNASQLLMYYNDINSFERQLTDGGMIILKFFLCISKKEQKKRFQRLEASPSSAWRVSQSDWEHNKQYDAYKTMYDEMLEQTDTACAPWTIIEATDRRFATVKIYTAVINALTAVVDRKKAAKAQAEAQAKAQEEAQAKAQEEAVEDVVEDVCEEVVEDVCEDVIEDACEDVCEEVIEEVPEDACEEASEDECEEASEDECEEKPESEFEDALEEEIAEVDEAVPEEVCEEAPEDPAPAETSASIFDDDVLRTSSLNNVDLSLSLTKEEYRKQLKYYQDKISELHGEMYKARIPVILGFEGWDAAGKGGSIKRLTEKMDPRGYVVHPSASPTYIEKVHHYLWRFWTHIPKDGHITIFDRTWYGRVMVERIEGFCTTEEWQRAYQEINEMEKQFVEHGAIVIKFWLQIDKDEQERRFKARMSDPNKQYKITDEDWRNREKWDEYEKAVDEMLVRTSTSAAPWVIVEGNSKYYARIKVLKTVVEAMEKRLEEVKKEAAKETKKESKKESKKGAKKDSKKKK